jgi:hypothetical protein
MKLKTYPFIINGIFFFQLVDKALADIAEWSDIVGKYFEVDHYLIPLCKRFNHILTQFYIRASMFL